LATSLGKYPSQKRAGGVTEGVGPEFNPSTVKRKKTRGGGGRQKKS
jgi:hypothetical protein